MKPDAVTRFGLIRHATTLWNEEKRIQGQQDSPLSDKGRAMATAWGKQLQDTGWQRILSSNLGRTVETAELVNRALHLPLHQDTRLREQDWGTWTGKTLADLKQNEGTALQEQVQRGWDFLPPQGESRRTVLKRSLAALNDAAARWPEEKILVICHEGVIKCLLYHLLGREFLPEEPPAVKKSHLHLLAQNGDSLYPDTINFLALTDT